MKKFILNNISRLPIFINKLLLKLNRSPSLIYGQEYANFFKSLQEEEEYDNEKDLINLINRSIDDVPYYSKYQKISTIKDFESQFDFIDKDVVSRNFDILKSKTMNEDDYEIVTTGGTGGNPLKLLVPRNRYIVELSVMHDMWSRVEFRHHTRAVIRNRKLEESQEYIINPITKEVIFDGFRLNSNYFQKIYDIIKFFNIQYIHAYPSTAYEFSRFIYDNKLDISFVKAFLSGSENVYKYQKEFITKKLGVLFYNWYGHSEKLVLGGYCSYSDNYHIEPRYGYFELIDREGNPINTPGRVGEIVGTTLNNYGMPLIRYKTDDYAEYVGNYCEKCGRRVTLIKNIEGRRNGNKIYGADGSTVTTTALNFHDDLYMALAGLQYIQNEKGVLDVLIIKNNYFTENHEKRLKDHFKSKFSLGTRVNIKYVDKLIKKPNGKFVELLSTVK
ncbi:phenylacetate--CoA ligase family protein [Maribacter thermophilus]|uniref:phenylacetate--CoA ligase family protein n=1 Tax=Maribacter thermophilus TaxID=1197874 RepID=UPI000640F984|nr:phenylacetate--CoA ligase family protein [Maribacter thermophilus]